MVKIGLKTRLAHRTCLMIRATCDCLLVDVGPAAAVSPVSGGLERWSGAPAVSQPQ